MYYAKHHNVNLEHTLSYIKGQHFQNVFSFMHTHPSLLMIICWLILTHLELSVYEWLGDIKLTTLKSIVIMKNIQHSELIGSDGIGRDQNAEWAENEPWINLYRKISELPKCFYSLSVSFCVSVSPSISLCVSLCLYLSISVSLPF